MSYFELFALPVSFYPSKEAVRKKYFELSRLSHPDYFAGAEAADQSEVLQHSADINKAYKILSHTESTLAYVLQLKGLLKADDKQLSLPPQFLMEVMELNEEAEELKKDTDPARRLRLEAQVKEMEEMIYAPVKNYMENYTEGSSSEEELLQVKDYYLKKKYLQRISEALGGML